MTVRASSSAHDLRDTTGTVQDRSPEMERLAALYRYEVLDTAPETEFDRVVALACALFDVPIAAVSLVDANRQFLKAQAGLCVTETARDVSFCTHVVDAKQLVVIPDARADARFVANPYVIGDPKVRFYAGAPLLTPDWHCLGALCIVSHAPRPGLSKADRDRLKMLAGIVSNELELRLQLRTAERLAAEKDLLLREVHHRVRNSLQLVNSILQTQAMRASDAGVRQALENAGDRIVTVSQAHRLLYQSRTVTEGDAPDYLSALLRQLGRGLTDGTNVRPIELLAAGPLSLSAEVLPRVGLVVTELVVNAIKHGAGRILVGLASEGDDILVSVADEGDGFPAGFNPSDRRLSLGFHVIRMLAAPNGVAIGPDRRRVTVRMRR